MTFKELGLNDALMKAIEDMGFENPTPIQQQTIPLLKEKSTDLVALAQTGTGKTAAFGLPILNTLDTNTKDTQALILSPTRELCVQITNDLKKYAKYYKGLMITSVYGGASIVNQMRDIKQGSQIIVATPGRLVDLIERRAVKLSTVKTIVLDEADEMLNMGFKDSLDAILEQTPDGKNTWLFSATMPREVERIAKNYMTNPAEISAGKKNEGAANITHIYYMVNSRERYAALKRVVDFYPEIFGVVFCRTKAETQEVADALIKDGYSADALHGDLSQGQRDFVMKRFRNKTLQMLVATDVAARGIDVQGITHVINYNLPEDIESYTHRSGRTARAGKSGLAISIITSRDNGKIKDIERIINKKFERGVLPNGFDVTEKQLFHLVKKLHDVEVNDEDIEKYLPKVYEELKDLSKEEIIKRFISEEFNRFFAYYENAADLNAGSEGSGNNKTSRFFINLGSLDGFNRNSLKDFLAEISKVHPRMLFNIDVKGSFSFFETESKYVDTFLGVNKEELEFNNRKVSIEASAKRMRDGGGEERRGGGGFNKGGRGGFDKGRRDGGSSDRGGFSGSKGKFGGHRERKNSGGDRSDSGRRSFGKRDGEKPAFGKSEFKKKRY
ncbi:MAG: DEAD/DEAH box helicase [Sphingobacteriaceae bacterium]